MVASGENSLLQLPGGVEMTVEVNAAQSGGAFTMLRDRAPAGWALPPHRHAVSETIHVLAGTMWFEVGARRMQLRSGQTVHVPAGQPHAGGTLGDADLQRLVVFAPAGMEELFRALAHTDDRADALFLAQRHGWEFLTGD